MTSVAGSGRIDVTVVTLPALPDVALVESRHYFDLLTVLQQIGAALRRRGAADPADGCGLSPR